jgi:hypothetical protein
VRPVRIIVGFPPGGGVDITARLIDKETNAAIADPKLKARLADLGGTVLPGSPAEFGKLIADETEKWGKVIRAAGRRGISMVFPPHGPAARQILCEHSVERNVGRICAGLRGGLVVRNRRAIKPE